MRFSRVAIALYADGNLAGLRRYLAGDRCSQEIIAYFKRCVDPLPPWLPLSTGNGSYQKQTSSAGLAR